MGSIVIGVRGWLIWVALAGVAAMGVGAFCALRNPPPPEPCRETVDMVQTGCTSGCPPGSRFEWATNERGAGALFRCTCPGPAAADAGAPSENR
jgi:hypothetical protein